MLRITEKKYLTGKKARSKLGKLSLITGIKIQQTTAEL